MDNMATATKRPRYPLKDDFALAANSLERFILDNYVALTKQLQVKTVIPYLLQEGILRRDGREEVVKCTTNQDMAEALLDKVMTRGTCTPSMFVDILRRSDHGHLADMLEGKPNGMVSWTEGIGDMTDSQLDELRSRLETVYREEVERHEGNTSLEGLMGFELRSSFIAMTVKWVDLVFMKQRRRTFGAQPSPSFVVKEEADRQLGTAFVADWVGDKEVTSNFGQVYKLKLDDVRKDQTIQDAIFEQLLWDGDNNPSFSKEALWNYMKQTQEEILFVLEGLDRLSPFTSPEILQLIDNKLLPRATVIVTVADANAA